MPVRVTVWNEFRHEKQDARVAEIYPHGIHEAIASHCARASGFALPPRRSISRSTGSANRGWRRRTC